MQTCAKSKKMYATVLMRHPVARQRRSPCSTHDTHAFMVWLMCKTVTNAMSVAMTQGYELGRPLSSLKASLIENSPSSNLHTQTIENSKFGYIRMPTVYHFFKFSIKRYQHIKFTKSQFSRNLQFAQKNICFLLTILELHTCCVCFWYSGSTKHILNPNIYKAHPKPRGTAGILCN